ncbi:MAG TPA: exo-alpha-sialidase [Spirochaetes bacterium]|nr:exo-alpha-sialidase [Spirochaetota bacterium]
MIRLLKITGTVIGALVLALALLLLYWRFRPNTAEVNPALGLEVWDAVNDGMHNSNTDMIFFKDHFYLVHASSPYHFATPECRLYVWRSKDAKKWEKLSTVRVPGEDIRDPKFLSMGGRLYMYVLKSVQFEAEPYKTAYVVSDDGIKWSALTDMEPEGWLFWRPKTRDGKTWYIPAYWWEHNKSMLLMSTDGSRWKKVSDIYEGGRNDETAIEFLPDGTMIATLRLEYSDSLFGDKRASTGIRVSRPPYTEWAGIEDKSTRLDGPALFSYNGRVYAIGRRHVGTPGLINYHGSIFTRKRTSLYLVTPERLVFLSDLPSAGDTTYAGYVKKGDTLYFSYYTSDPKRDFPWIMGMVLKSPILMARLDLPSLEKLAIKKMRATK